MTSPSTPPRQEYAPERVFISTPAEPRRRGNRGIGVLIALGAVIPFGILLAAIAAIILATVAPEQPFGPIFTLFFASPLFYVPAILFVVAFIVLVLIGNRAGWWAYVLGSLFVGAFVYFGTIGVELVARNLLTMTPAEASEQFATAAANPFVIAAGLAAREVAMWIGSIIAVRGRRVKERNLLARLDYERELAEHQAEFAKTRYPFE